MDENGKEEKRKEKKCYNFNHGITTGKLVSYLQRFLHYANNYVIKIKSSKRNIFKMASVKLKIITIFSNSLFFS